MDPNASVGMHKHGETEEVYYILEGSLEITTVSASGDRQATATLNAGDAHHITFGESHSAVAGPEGTKIFVVELGR